MDKQRAGVWSYRPARGACAGRVRVQSVLGALVATLRLVLPVTAAHGGVSGPAWKQLGAGGRAPLYGFIFSSCMSRLVAARHCSVSVGTGACPSARAAA